MTDIARWRGERWHYEISLWRPLGGRDMIALVAGDDLDDEELEAHEIDITREDALAIIAGLQNAVRELDNG